MAFICKGCKHTHNFRALGELGLPPIPLPHFTSVSEDGEWGLPPWSRRFIIEGQGSQDVYGAGASLACPLASPECGSGGAEGVCSGVIEFAAWRRWSRNPGCCQLSDPPKREPFVLARRSSRPPPGCPQPASIGPVPPSHSPSWTSELCREMPNQLAWCYVVYLSYPF